ncbi:MAG: hypothetical protein K0S53_2295 [Bacteroidetes bacterium]|jgi:hypothetical protein|nr:hypothetical protein [Bacteroidota bacterium]
MKNLIILLSLICIQSSTYFSQTDSLFRKNKKEIDVNYNWSHLGRSMNLNYNHYFGCHALSIGVRQHYNNGAITDNQNYVYKNRGYSTNFSESIGLNIGYKFDLLKKHDYLMPYLFFQSQISNIRFKRTYEYSEIRDNVLVYHTDSEISKLFLVTENYIGFGLKVKLYKNLYLNQTIGVGIATFKGEDTRGMLFNKPINANIEFSHSVKIGLIYQFK